MEAAWRFITDVCSGTACNCWERLRVAGSESRDRLLPCRQGEPGCPGREGRRMRRRRKKRRRRRKQQEPLCSSEHYGDGE